MPQLYSLELSIAEFFAENATVTKEECDLIARSLIGEPVLPVSIQGVWSYTVIAGEPQRIVQFRAQDSVLDMEKLKLAREIHLGFVPSIEYHCDVGKIRPLSIYTIDKVLGVPHVIANTEKKAGEVRLNTVRDFSRFFAQAWNSPQFLSSVELHDMEVQLNQKLDILLVALPARYTPILRVLRKHYLHLLFEESYPVVLTHGDLCSLNVLVDPDLLHITGIIDWADADLAPFGLALYGIFNILGVMDSEGWHYHANYQDIISQFWATLEHETCPLSPEKRNIIRAACAIGILLENGFTWNGRDKSTPVKEGDDSMGYLEAWLGDESSMNDLLLSQEQLEMNETVDKKQR